MEQSLMQSLLRNSDKQAKSDWSEVYTCNNNNRSNSVAQQQPFVNSVNYCHDNSNTNQSNLIINNITTSQVEPARFASNMSYTSHSHTNNVLPLQTSANNILNTINGVNANNYVVMNKSSNTYISNTNKVQTQILRTSGTNDGNSNNYEIMHQDSNNNCGNEHNNVNDHFTLLNNHIIGLQTRNSQTCQRENMNESISTTMAAIREGIAIQNSSNNINNKCNEANNVESNKIVFPTPNNNTTLLSTEESNPQDAKWTQHHNCNDNIIGETPQSAMLSELDCKANQEQTLPSPLQKTKTVTSTATALNATPTNTIVIPLKNISFANTPSKAPNSQSLSSLSSSILCNVHGTASPGVTTATMKDNSNNSNNNVVNVNNYNANYELKRQDSTHEVQNAQLMYILLSSALRSTNTNESVNRNVNISTNCSNNTNACNYGINADTVNNQNVPQGIVNATTVQNMPIRELSQVNNNTNSSSLSPSTSTFAHMMAENNIMAQNVLAHLSSEQLCRLAHSLNVPNKHQHQQQHQPQKQSLSFDAQPVVLVNPTLLTSQTSLTPQVPCQLMPRSCVLPAAQMGMNANMLQSNATVAMNNNTLNNINNNLFISNNTSNLVASQNELLMKMLLKRQRQVTASVNTQVLQQEILPTHHRCNGTGYVLHCLYEGTVKRYNPVRGFGFLTANVQLIEIDRAKMQELLMVLKQPSLLQEAPCALHNEVTNQMTRIQEVQNCPFDHVANNLNQKSNECVRSYCNDNTNKTDNTSTIQTAAAAVAASEEPYRYYLRHPVCLGDIFVHQSYLQMHGFRSLPIGGRVRFRAEQFNGQNSLHATDVELLPQTIPSEVMRKLQQGEKEAELLQCMSRMNTANQQVCNIATTAANNSNTSTSNINDHCLTRNVIDNNSSNNINTITTNSSNNNSVNAVALHGNMNTANNTNIIPFQEACMLHRNKCISTFNTNPINGVGGNESVSTLGLSYTVKEISQSNDLTHHHYNNSNNNSKTESTLIINPCNNATSCANDLCWLDSAKYASVLCDDYIGNHSSDESINSFNCEIDCNDCELTYNKEKV